MLIPSERKSSSSEAKYFPSPQVKRCEILLVRGKWRKEFPHSVGILLVLQKHVFLRFDVKPNEWCQELPCLTNVWLVSRRISQPSTIMRSIARFFLMFSVSLTSSCMILRTRRHVIILVSSVKHVICPQFHSINHSKL